MTEILDLEKLARDRLEAIDPRIRGGEFQTSMVNGEVLSFQYDLSPAVITPRTVATSTFFNNTTAQAGESFTDSKTTTSSSSWTVNQGVTFGVSVTAGVNYIFSGSVTASATISFSKSETKSVSFQQGWTWNTSIPMPPKSRVEVSVIINEASYHLHFHATVRYIGEAAIFLRPLGPDTIGLGWSVGALFRNNPHPRVTVIDDNTITVDVEGTFEGVAGIDYVVKADQYPLEQGGGRISTKTLPLYQSSTLLDKGEAFDDGPSVGPPDGISYIVIGSNEETRMSPMCGFNDIGLPNPAVYRMEQRQYSEYSKGTLIRTWSEKVETFLRCG